MSDTAALLTDATGRLFGHAFDDDAMRRARSGEWLSAAWELMVEHGLPRALTEGEDGYGIPLDTGLALVRLIGRHALPLPLAETMIGNVLLARAGLPTTDSPIALVPQGSVRLRADGATLVADGSAERIAWGRQAGALLIEDGDRIALVTTGFETTAEGSNLALMPRDTIRVAGSAAVADLPNLSVLEAGALIRAVMMAGALDALVELTIGHVSERIQFGRPLSAFQAVQHQLAQLAGEAAAGAAAAAFAARAFAHGSPRTRSAIAAARARLGDAATMAIGIAHQLHGAIGFTKEHRLHWYTTALWSWSDEFGSSAWWTRELGVEALGESKASYWPFVTSI